MTKKQKYTSRDNELMLVAERVRCSVLRKTYTLQEFTDVLNYAGERYNLITGYEAETFRLYEIHEILKKYVNGVTVGSIIQELLEMRK